MKQVIMMFLLMVSTLLSVEAQIMSIYWLYPKFLQRNAIAKMYS